MNSTTVSSKGLASSPPVSSTVKLSSTLFQSISGTTSVASSQSASVVTSLRASVSTTTFQSTKATPQGPGLPPMPLSTTRTSLSEVSRVNLATGQVSTSDTGAIVHASSSTVTPSKTAISSTAILSTSSRGPVSVSRADSIQTSTRTSSTTVVVVHSSKSPTPTLTETLTDQPESTFTSPVAITLVDHGKTVVSIPPLITVLSTTTDGDGSFVTFTHVIANPTGLSGIKDDSSSLLQNAGKTAGVFLVVGLAAAFIIFCLFWLCRRRSRKNHQRRWLAHMQRPISPETVDPFQDPRTGVPETVLFNSGNHPWDFAQNQKPSQVNYGTATMGLGLTGINDSPNDRYSRNDTREIGLAITTRSASGKSQMSLAQSSPSLYPPTLPAEYPDDIFEEMELQEEPRKVPPPRPPRSHLRDSVKASAGYPLTPPSSESSHTAVSNPPSPLEFRPQPFAEGRRTLLDVRPRASHDDMTTVRL